MPGKRNYSGRFLAAPKKIRAIGEMKRWRNRAQFGAVGIRQHVHSLKRTVEEWCKHDALRIEKKVIG
jgi:hypothetical protein